MTGPNLTRNFDNDVVNALRHPFDPDYRPLHANQEEQHSRLSSSNNSIVHPECSTPNNSFTDNSRTASGIVDTEDNETSSLSTLNRGYTSSVSPCLNFINTHHFVNNGHLYNSNNERTNTEGDRQPENNSLHITQNTRTTTTDQNQNTSNNTSNNNGEDNSPTNDGGVFNSADSTRRRQRATVFSNTSKMVELESRDLELSMMELQQWNGFFNELYGHMDKMRRLMYDQTEKLLCEFRTFSNAHVQLSNALTTIAQVYKSSAQQHGNSDSNLSEFSSYPHSSTPPPQHLSPAPSSSVSSSSEHNTIDDLLFYRRLQRTLNRDQGTRNTEHVLSDDNHSRDAHHSTIEDDREREVVLSDDNHSRDTHHSTIEDDREREVVLSDDFIPNSSDLQDDDFVL